ncbi:MAG: M23 family metallopeptidase [Alphaproteobacteria bacterium]|nr:M23 family metallopeptidase [Alphaproteobacteria bacterium]
MRRLISHAGLRPAPWAAVAGLLAWPAWAEAPAFDLPIDCALGKDCYVWSYFDHDPDKGYRDYRCGRRTNEGHGGTDFAIGGRQRMAEGVRVLAAADGVVRGRRDGMRDAAVLGGDRRALAGKFCGNGVNVDHGGGWSAQYCHMRRGSVSVQVGERVRRGQVLGFVGLSGLAELPHLHFEVLRDGRKIDPFRGVDGGPRCGLGARPLWTDAALKSIDYEPVLLHAAGFGTGPVDWKRVRAGKYPKETLPTSAPALTVWVEILGVRAADQVRLELRDPRGRVIADSDHRFDKYWARWTGFTGRKRPAQGWAKGRYQGRIELVHRGPDGQRVIEETREIEVR